VDEKERDVKDREERKDGLPAKPTSTGMQT
jgi:hypothetical protein